jgi:hypothetical protein
LERPGRYVSKNDILVIDFVTAFFNLGVKKTAWWMIKYPLIKKNAAIAIAQLCPDTVHGSKVTTPGCS